MSVGYFLIVVSQSFSKGFVTSCNFVVFKTTKNLDKRAPLRVSMENALDFQQITFSHRALRSPSSARPAEGSVRACSPYPGPQRQACTSSGCTGS